MKLLIITQKMDRNDPVLGFFHRWCEKIAARLSRLHIICLQQGTVALPPQVTVQSLGKERKASRLAYIFSFYRLIWCLRAEYDVVFVHMNPVYILLGCVFWSIWRKPFYLWYNHEHGNLMTWFAARLAHTVFHTSAFSYTARFPNSRKMPAGIDMELFSPRSDLQKIPNSILYIGRIAPIKKIDVLVQAAILLHRQGIPFTLTVAGAAEPHDAAYEARIKYLARRLAFEGVIHFPGSVPNYETPRLYREHELFVNLSPPGLFDKAVLEAMACETPVIASSSAFARIIPSDYRFTEDRPEALAQTLLAALAQPLQARLDYGRLLREYVMHEHSLEKLVTDIAQALE